MFHGPYYISPPVMEWCNLSLRLRHSTRKTRSEQQPREAASPHYPSIHMIIEPRGGMKDHYGLRCNAGRVDPPRMGLDSRLAEQPLFTVHNSRGRGNTVQYIYMTSPYITQHYYYRFHLFCLFQGVFLLGYCCWC